MTTSKQQLVGQITVPGQKPQNVSLVVKEMPNFTSAESAAEIQWVDSRYEPGHVLRYGTNVVPGTTVMTTAVAAVFAVADTHLGYFPGETFLTDRIIMISGSNIYMAPGCILKDTGLLSESGPSERFLNIGLEDAGISNVHIEAWGAKVQMTRSDYTSGEQRHGVFIFESSDVTIDGLESSDCGGDGFYVGGVTTLCSQRIRLNWIKADNNRRNNLTIANVKTLRVIDGIFTNATGTSPRAGIDIEPNAATNCLQDIKIVRPRCTGNGGTGIKFFLNTWASATNYCDVSIIDPYTEANGQDIEEPGIWFDIFSDTAPASGSINIINPVCVDEQYAGIKILDWDIDGPRINLIRPTVINPNQAEDTDGGDAGGIILENLAVNTTTPGNVYIENPYIIDDDGFLNADSLYTIAIAGLWKDVTITNPKAISGRDSAFVIDDEAAVAVVYDDQPKFDTATGLTITFWRHTGKVITNNGASGTITHTLPLAVPGQVQDFAVDEAFEVRIAPNSSDRIWPIGTAVNKYITTAARGNRVTVRCREANAWMMENVVGTWTSEA